MSAAAVLPAMAMSVTPSVIDMSTSGAKNRGQITVTNDGAKPLPVEIMVSRIELNENGDMTATPADDDFAISPMQTLVAPGATQNFRIQWLGGPQIPTSQHYIFSINQVPVTMPEGQSGVQVVFNFATIVNIAPPDGNAAIALVAADIGKDNNGKPRPAITVKNPGNSYAKFTDATIKLSSGTWSQTLSPAMLRQAMGVGLLQPGKTRRFLLPVDLPGNVSDITASVDYKPGK